MWESPEQQHMKVSNSDIGEQGRKSVIHKTAGKRSGAICDPADACSPGQQLHAELKGQA
jgi:hypothetical protein